MREDFEIKRRTPTPEEYNRIREAAGLSVKDEIAVERGLAGTLFAVCIEYEGETVGIGRVIGDGGIFFEVVDIAVVPEHQKKGLGAAIMEELMSWVHEHARPTAFVSLISDKGMSGFYERYGFKVRPPESPGMSQTMLAPDAKIT